MSFELGIPEEELAQRLTERSFVLYQAYAARKLLPARRVQLQLARIALTAAQVAGNADVELADFLFDPLPDAGDDVDLDAAKVHFQFNPRNKA